MLNLLLANTSAIVDIVALSIIALFALAGLTKGFAKSFFSVFGTILALFLAALLAATVADYLEEKFFLVSKISSKISGFLDGYFGKEIMGISLGLVNEEILSLAGVSDFISNIIISFKSDPNISQEITLAQIIYPTFAYYIVLILSAITLFIIFKIIFIIIARQTKKPKTSSLVGKLDRFLGFFLGIIHGIISLELLIMIISIIPNEVVQEVYKAIQASSFANLIENINIYSYVLSAFANTDVTAHVKSIIIAK